MKQRISIKWQGLRGKISSLLGLKNQIRPEGGPEGSGGFACRYVGLFDFGLRMTISAPLSGRYPSLQWR